MTPVSRFAPDLATLRRVRHGTTSRIACWHAVCLTFTTGCFYVRPIPDVEVNQPPIIVIPAENPRTVFVTGDQVVLTVRATDPEGDPLDFAWPEVDNLAGADWFAQERGEFTVSIATLTDLDQLPPNPIEAFVSDGDRDNTVVVSFDVVLP